MVVLSRVTLTCSSPTSKRAAGQAFHSSPRQAYVPSQQEAANDNLSPQPPFKCKRVNT